MKIKVLFFAGLREAFDCNEKFLDIPHDGILTPELLLKNFSIAEKGPWLELLNKKKIVRVAINQTLVEWQSPLNDGDELAFLPPITGG